MMRTLKNMVVLVLVFTLLFLFLPVGQDEDAIISDFGATTSYATAFNLTQAQLLAPYMLASEVNLKDIDGGLAIDADSLVASGHLACLEDGTPIDLVPTSSFPRRGRSYTGATTLEQFDFSDNTANTGNWHRGCDLRPLNNEHRSQPVYLCSYWDGEVVLVSYDTSYGWHVVVKHSEHLFTQYCHMAYGYGASKDYGATDPNSLGEYQRDFTEIGRAYVGKHPVVQGHSSILVKEGDHVKAGQALGILGSTGSSTGMHGHIELYVCPNGFEHRWETGGMFYANISNMHYNHLKPSELTWYQHTQGVAAVSGEMFEDFDPTGGEPDVQDP